MKLKYLYHFSEPMVESIPQLLIMIFIIVNNLAGAAISLDNFFWSSFVSSLLSSAFSLSKLLKTGPYQLMPSDTFGLTFVLIFFCNFLGLLGKGFFFTVLNAYRKIHGYATFYAPMAFIITSILPPVTLVSKLPTIFLYHFISFRNFQKLCLYSNFSNSLTLQ